MVFDIIYFEQSLRKVRSFWYATDSNNDDEDNGNMPLPSAPQETISANSPDFLTTNENEKNTITDKVREILLRDNLKVNESTTEQTELFRGGRNPERWTTVKKLGSLLGDTKDIQRRKLLVIASMNRLNNIWTRKDHISE